MGGGGEEKGRIKLSVVLVVGFVVNSQQTAALRLKGKLQKYLILFQLKFLFLLGHYNPHL